MNQHRCHAVRAIDGDFQVRQVFQIFAVKINVFGFEIKINDFAFRGHWHHLSRFAHRFQFAQTGIQANGQSLRPRNLQSIVFLRVMRGGYLHRRLEPKFCGGVVNHRRGGEPGGVNICARIGYAAAQRFENLGRRSAHVAANKYLVGFEQFRNKKADFVNIVFIELVGIDSANVVGVKSVHNSKFFCYAEDRKCR